ncbi:hypothetical protein GS473_17420 [Rhodococcus hoagii]|nr:hypothetical protein [Prescottella equi]
MAAAHVWMQREIATPVDLSVDRLVQTGILQVGDRHFLWYSRSHHIALDGYGAATMLYRIAHLYTAAVEGREPDPPAATDLRSLHDIDERYRASDRHDTDRAYWAHRLDGVRGVTLVGAGAPAVAESRLVTSPLSNRAMRRLERSEDGQGPDASAAARIIAAFACFLSRTTGSRDVVVDIPVSARTTARTAAVGDVHDHVAASRRATQETGERGDDARRGRGVRPLSVLGPFEPTHRPVRQRRCHEPTFGHRGAPAPTSVTPRTPSSRCAQYARSVSCLSDAR